MSCEAVRQIEASLTAPLPGARRRIPHPGLDRAREAHVFILRTFRRRLLIPWVQLATAAAPGGGELKLMQRGEEHSITIDGVELMNSRRGGSETALGHIGCAPLRQAAAPRVLIGGLGMGFTLRAALGELGSRAEITVAELVPEVVDWAHGPLAGIFGKSLEDPRVSVVQADVADLVACADGSYDAILLDVDNGADGLVRSANDRLYDENGLSGALRALKPEGVLAVWSASYNQAFRRRLVAAGFAVREHAARSGRAKRGARHLIWLASAPAGRQPSGR